MLLSRATVSRADYFCTRYQKFLGGGKIKGTAGWFHSLGMKPGRLYAYAAATTELGVGALISLGLLTPLASAGLIALMTVAIVTVHRKNGCFNFRQGQGVEYTVGIAVMALVPSAAPGRYSLDHVWHVPHWTATTSVLVTRAVGLGGAAAQLVTFFRPPKQG